MRGGELQRRRRGRARRPRSSSLPPFGDWKGCAGLDVVAVTVRRRFIAREPKGLGSESDLPAGRIRLAKDFSPANLSLGLRGMSGGRAAAELVRIDGALRIPLEAVSINRWLPLEPSVSEKAPR